MQQNLPYQQPYQYGMQRQLRIIPITNKQEANSTQVDYNGVPTFFYNQSTGEIYKKQFDISTGLATFQEYTLTGSPISNENTQTGNITYKDELNAIYGKIDGLEQTIKELLKIDDVKGAKNAK